MSETQAPYNVNPAVYSGDGIVVGVDVSTTALGLAAVEIGLTTFITTATDTGLVLAGNTLIPVTIGRANARTDGRSGGKVKSPRPIIPVVASVTVRGKNGPRKRTVTLPATLMIPGRYLNSRQLDLPKQGEGQSEAEWLALITEEIRITILAFVADMALQFGKVVAIAIEQPARGGWGSGGNRASGNGAMCLQAVGAAQTAAGHLSGSGLRVFGPYPQETKLCFAGHGGALKSQMRGVARVYSGLGKVGEDEADGIAAAATGVKRYQEGV